MEYENKELIGKRFDQLSATSQAELKRLSGTDSSLAQMIKHNAPLTREEYLAWDGIEDPSTIDAEYEATIPQMFQK